MKASEQDADNVAGVSAIKLLDFFQDIGRCEAKRPIFSTNLTQQACPSLRTCGPVSAAWVEKWMKQWGLDVKEGGDSDSGGVASKASPSELSGHGLLGTLEANGVLTSPHQEASSPAGIPVVTKAVRAVPAIA